MQKELKETFYGKTVLVTGHTGFKGTWLTIWLQELGAKVIGYSLEPPTTPSIFEITETAETMNHIIGDVRDLKKLSQTIQEHKPEVIFHLAAQPIVLHSFDQPQETFSVNVGGTVNLLEASRNNDFIKAIVIITTDKVYENREWVWGYRENDVLGGNDPYSASKAMAEMAADSYRKSFFTGSTAIATARAGNVIGGGDFSDFRLIPDAMKALMNRKPVEVRNPNSIRPWMHVLDPLRGYLTLASCLVQDGQMFAEAWNFGPLEHEAISAQRMVEKSIELWGDGDWLDVSSLDANAETNLLRLNWDKAANRLDWHPVYNWEIAIAETIDWFKEFENYSQNPKNAGYMREVCVSHVNKYMQNFQPRKRS
ncbi:MAG: CDP-glucose 4,6-dehydratase [Chlamydiae bacterium]|nr:CDP-glucose 4,6-dehydratase [Chlamydiota bacterium]